MLQIYFHPRFRIPFDFASDRRICTESFDSPLVVIIICRFYKTIGVYDELLFWYDDDLSFLGFFSFYRFYTMSERCLYFNEQQREFRKTVTRFVWAKWTTRNSTIASLRYDDFIPPADWFVKRFSVVPSKRKKKRLVNDIT